MVRYEPREVEQHKFSYKRAIVHFITRLMVSIGFTATRKNDQLSAMVDTRTRFSNADRKLPIRREISLVNGTRSTTIFSINTMSTMQLSGKRSDIALLTKRSNQKVEGVT